MVKIVYNGIVFYDILKIAAFSFTYFCYDADHVHTAVEMARKYIHVNFFVHFKPRAVQQWSNTDVVPKHAFYVWKQLGEMWADQKGAAGYVFIYFFRFFVRDCLMRISIFNKNYNLLSHIFFLRAAHQRNCISIDIWYSLIEYYD